MMLWGRGSLLSMSWGRELGAVSRITKYIELYLVLESLDQYFEERIYGTWSLAFSLVHNEVVWKVASAQVAERGRNCMTFRSKLGVSHVEKLQRGKGQGLPVPTSSLIQITSFWSCFGSICFSARSQQKMTSLSMFLAPLIYKQQAQNLTSCSTPGLEAGKRCSAGILEEGKWTSMRVLSPNTKITWIKFLGHYRCWQLKNLQPFGVSQGPLGYVCAHVHVMCSFTLMSLCAWYYVRGVIILSTKWRTFLNSLRLQSYRHFPGSRLYWIHSLQGWHAYYSTKWQTEAGKSEIQFAA